MNIIAKLIIGFTLTLMANNSFAKKVSVDSTKSVVEWMGRKELLKLKDSHEGTVQIAPQSYLEMSGGKFTGGQIVINMSTLENTDIPKEKKKKRKMLISHLESADFFDVENNKASVFDITGVRMVKNSKNNEYEFTGALTIRGKKVPNKTITAVVDEVAVKGGKKAWKATGKMIFDRTQFGVKYKSKTFYPNLWKKTKDKVISNDIELTFNIMTAAI